MVKTNVCPFSKESADCSDSCALKNQDFGDCAIVVFARELQAVSLLLGDLVDVEQMKRMEGK